jgi:tetratricopeptide (TPR) repeat protein
VDPTLPGRLTELRAVLTRADARYGARRLTTAVTDQLGQIELMLADAQGPLRARLAELASLYTEFLGWLYDDLGEPERGRALTVRAQDLAELSRNPSLVSYMLMRRAQQAAIAREPQLAVALAGEALQGEGTYPRVLAGSAIRRAYGLALNREPDAALESMDTAVELAARPTTEHDPYRLAPWLTTHYLQAHRASVLLVLGRALDAAAAFDEALRDWPAEYHRERGLHLSRKACALALAGAMDEALDAGAQALVIARETGSQRVLHHLDFAATTMARRDQGGSDVRAFSEAVAAAAGEK